ncbi:hypothetical protein OG338_24640 [Streptomyces sp. NBC_00726]|uniref:hypothetical protein n=1 Tax=Streptomyces sp. NBC_00726 TaxID=2903674 RepID=UPI0038631E09
MPLMSPLGIFSVLERRCAGSDPEPSLHRPDTESGTGVRVSLAQARQLLYDRSTCPALRAALWLQIAERAHRDAEDRQSWLTAALWLGLPGLRRTASKIIWAFGAEQGDVEAELATCYLEALMEIEPQEAGDLGGEVLRSACSRAWNVWRRARLERATDDVDGVRGGPFAPDVDEFWQADYEPVPSDRGLSATVRITVPAHRVEGVRLGALAQAWGLAETATSAGYSGRGRQVAKLSLRRTRKVT